MSNRLRLTGILTPPADDSFRPGTGYVKFEPADDRAAAWAVPGYRPVWPVIGVPNGVGGSLIETNGGDVYVPGDEPGDAHAGPWMRVSYELQTTAGTWHRGTYLWRAVSTGGGVIDIRTPAPENEPPIVSRPGVPAGALLTTDVDNLVPSMAAFAAATAAPAAPGGGPLIVRTGGPDFASIQRQEASWRGLTPALLIGNSQSIITFASEGILFVNLSFAEIAGWRLASASWSATDLTNSRPLRLFRNATPGTCAIEISGPGQHELYIDVETFWTR